MTNEETLSEIRRLAGVGGRPASVAPLFDAFRESAPANALGEAAAALTGIAGERARVDSIVALTAQIGELRLAVSQQREKVEENSRAMADNTSARVREVAQTGRDFVDDLRGRSGLGSALLGAPLVSAISRLFRRSPAPGPEPLPAFALPSALRIDAALAGETGEGLRAVSTAQGGELRTAERPPAPSVTVQVQTMDSRSFLDNSDQIARAVREALLNMHSLSDAVREI